LHGQIRYFVEVFTIQCARRHPNIFGKALINEIKRINIAQQYVCSLMIVAGNLIVGKYSDDFINSSSLEKGEFDLKHLIAAAVPWLGSTQSFCRAIAQLLLHKLIPLAFPSVSKDNSSSEHNDWFFVRNTWLYLEENTEMQKLRKKQLHFFESYEADSVCTPEGIFGFIVDKADESNPPYLVDALKRCLIDIGNENFIDFPEWKQFEQLLQDGHHSDDDDDDGDDAHDNAVDDDEDLVNFQRKILPVDTLNLTIEDYKQQKLQNAAGRNRQSLIVCASLIDKVANLAGITRTAEIFAADRVLVPDSKVRKMDNFKSISVGAGEWVTIEECKENELLQWLKQCKKDGYKIVGVEQTSSSKCLSHVKFEGKSVLLLGKRRYITLVIPATCTCA
jgi:tRNA guanosine-2'-O-methyltransferase